MYTAEKLLEITALPVETPATVLCDLCGVETAAWNVTLRSPSTLLQQSRVRANVRACKKNCFPLRANVVDAMATQQDKFAVGCARSRVMTLPATNQVTRRAAGPAACLASHLCAPH